MVKPDNQTQSLADPRGPHKFHRWAAEAPQSETAISLLCLQTFWTELSTGPEGSKYCDIPPEFAPAPLLCHVARARIKMVFQNNDTREEAFNFASEEGGTLYLHMSMEIFEDGMVSEPGDLHRRRGLILGQL